MIAKKNKRPILLLTLLLVPLTNSRAQTHTSPTLQQLPSSALQLADTHRMDSVMQRLEGRFGTMKSWRYKVDDLDDVPSVVILKQNASATFNPSMLKSSAPLLVNQGSSSAFSFRDDVMWARDYNWGTFVSDMLIGW